MNSRGRRRIVGAVIGVVLVGVAIVAGRGIWSGGSHVRPAERVVPDGTRIQVEVLNATDVRGLARRAASYLRDAGFDVVYYGNTPERHDSTVVRDRSGHPEWSVLAQRTMAPALVQVQPDSARLVDLTVLVGTSWRAPPDPLRP